MNTKRHLASVTPSTAEQRQCIEAWRAGPVPEHMRMVVVPWVRACVLDAGEVSLRETRRRLTACSKLAVFMLNEHLALDRELAFDPANIERFTEHLIQTHESAAATYRWALRKMGPTLTREAPWPAPVPRIPRLDLAHPYSNVERRRLETASHRQSTPVKARIFSTTVALGFGAGLDGRWIPRVRVKDLRDDGNQLRVEVAINRPRLVPVLARYRTQVLHLADGLPRNSYLLTGTRFAHTTKSYLGDSLAKLDLPPGLPAFNAGRARSTWLLHHLTVGTRVDVLLAAAGIQGTQSLADLLPFLPPLAQSKAVAMLVGK